MTLRRVLIALLLVAVWAPAANAQQPKPPERQDEFVPISELPPEEQLPAQPLVIGAYAFAWLALGAYVVSVARRLDHVQREIDRLETETKRSG
jgi:CcmD family protein